MATFDSEKRHPTMVVTKEPEGFLYLPRRPLAVRLEVPTQVALQPLTGTSGIYCKALAIDVIKHLFFKLMSSWVLCTTKI